MAARIVPDDAEFAGQRRDLRIPHMQVCAQRIGQHQGWSALRTLDFDAKIARGGLQLAHALAPLARAL